MTERTIIPPKTAADEQLKVKLTTLAELYQRQYPERNPRGLQQHRKEPKTVNLLKIWAYGDLVRVLHGAPKNLGHHVDAVWLAFATDHFPSPGAAMMQIVRFFRRWRFILALPSLDPDWCRSVRHDHSFQFEARLRNKLRSLKERGAVGHVETIVAFRRGSLRCSSRQKLVQSVGLGESRLSGSSPAAPPTCFFGKSRRQHFWTSHGAGYDSYFLGPEMNEL
eukprot:TRINITY_DN5003_c1_g1_i2.p1 TRINITY_DN5003_c1_g1~~TRINITY_DN5003_c1_g1_i2.p1  ORF type:complete len:238 (-),score=36.33 TRINITY_DN5003_c1_g1_i2:56-721(-)